MTNPPAEVSRVLVTGGRGFIGSQLVRRLVAGGANVVSVDVAPIVVGKSRADEHVLDIRDGAALQLLFDRGNFDTVFDLASFTEAGLPSSAYRRNVDATEAITRIVQRNSTARYVFFSTQFVHRRPGVCPSGPRDYAPSEAYGESKVVSEELIFERIQMGRRLILRPTYIWGPGLHRFRTGLLFRLKKGQMLISNDPSTKRYYGYVDTIVEQACQLLTRWELATQEEVLYVSDNAIGLEDFCGHLIDAMGSGKFRKVPPSLLRALGGLGEVLKKGGAKAPIDSIQARELTSNFPIPLEKTLALTACETNYPKAAEATVRWAGSIE